MSIAETDTTAEPAGSVDQEELARSRRERIMKIARWTLPIWLYVSLTGVVVYWMLYQMSW